MLAWVTDFTRFLVTHYAAWTFRKVAHLHGSSPMHLLAQSSTLDTLEKTWTCLIQRRPSIIRKSPTSQFMLQVWFVSLTHWPEHCWWKQLDMNGIESTLQDSLGDCNHTRYTRTGFSHEHVRCKSPSVWMCLSPPAISFSPHVNFPIHWPRMHVSFSCPNIRTVTFTLSINNHTKYLC